MLNSLSSRLEEKQEDIPRIKSALIKLSARCNLNCDYCYVFNHADQSWKSLPPKMTEEVINNVARRIADYIFKNKLEQFLCIFHGGEPLLLGAKTIVDYKRLIEKEVYKQSRNVKLYFSLQTNGVLLKESGIELFEQENIGISMSIDGPKEVQDLHRLTHMGQSSYDKTKRGLDLLKKHPAIFEGVISVIDPRTDPRELLSFFGEINPPSCDFLLPDSNYVKKPFYKDKHPSCYIEWLKKCFDLWIKEFPHLRIRFFESICEAILTGVSNTEAFGLGDISLLSVETDGSYHDTDIFKTTTENFSRLSSLNVKNNTFDDAIRTEKIHQHRQLLRKEGLSERCKKCDIVDICGGGCVQHRYNPKNGFDNPSIYCEELYSIIHHISSHMKEMILNSNTTEMRGEKHWTPQISKEFDAVAYTESTPSSRSFSIVFNHWAQQCLEKLIRSIDHHPLLKPLKKQILELPLEQKIRFSTFPSVILWTTLTEREAQGLLSYSLGEKKKIEFDASHLNSLFRFLAEHEKDSFFVHQEDHLLRCLFDDLVVFESDKKTIQYGKKLAQEALALIKDYSPGLYEEMKMISPCIQFIQDPSAHPEKLVSFSDNHVPGCLYVCIRYLKGFASPEDLADSIIHEYRHQKLYLLENYTPVVLKDEPYVKSPWREEPRPVSGLFHGLFVFYELTKFWVWLRERSFPKSVVESTIQQNIEMMEQAIKELEKCSLSEVGHSLLTIMDQYTSSLQEVYIHRGLKCSKSPTLVV